jgi:hypothetical protein
VVNVAYPLQYAPLVPLWAGGVTANEAAVAAAAVQAATARGSAPPSPPAAAAGAPVAGTGAEDGTAASSGAAVSQGLVAGVVGGWFSEVCGRRV